MTEVKTLLGMFSLCASGCCFEWSLIGWLGGMLSFGRVSVLVAEQTGC